MAKVCFYFSMAMLTIAAVLAIWSAILDGHIGVLIQKIKSD